MKFPQENKKLNKLLEDFTNSPDKILSDAKMSIMNEEFDKEIDKNKKYLTKIRKEEKAFLKRIEKNKTSQLRQQRNVKKKNNNIFTVVLTIIIGILGVLIKVLFDNSHSKRRRSPNGTRKQI